MSITIAAFQMPFATANRAKNLELVLERLQWAEIRQVELVVFPECFLTGYFTNLIDAKAAALNIESSEFQMVLQQLEPFKSTIVLGLIETDGINFYNTAVVILNGTLLGKYRKTHPNEKCFVAGNEYPVFAVANFQFGINICADANFPEAAYRVAEAGANIIVYPLYNALPEDIAIRWREKSPENLRLRAIETGCYIISADVIGHDHSSLSYGCTQVFSPSGELMSAVSEFEIGVAMTIISREKL